MTDTKKTKVIAGHSFELTTPYAEGHTLTAAEAKALNQVRVENIGNNVRAKVQELLEAGKVAEAEELVRQKDAEYVFTLTNTGGSTKSLDPVEREARSLAREIVKLKLAEMGKKIGTPPEGETAESWKEKVEANIERIAATEGILAEAKKAVNAKKKRLEALSGIEI